MLPSQKELRIENPAARATSQRDWALYHRPHAQRCASGKKTAHKANVSPPPYCHNRVNMTSSSKPSLRIQMVSAPGLCYTAGPTGTQPLNATAKIVAPIIPATMWCTGFNRSRSQPHARMMPLWSTAKFAAAPSAGPECHATAATDQQKAT